MITLKTNDWELNNIKTVLFDKDGTFIDLHFFWGKMTEMRVSALLSFYNIPDLYFERLCAFLGYDYNLKKMHKNGITALYSRQKIIEILKVNLTELEVFATKSDLENIFDSVSDEFYKNSELYTKPILPAIDFIEKLRNKGVQTGIVTSDSVVSTKLTLKQFNWEHLFDVFVGRESSDKNKESGELTKIALDKLSANAKSTVMIGDAPMDYLSAKNAGIDNVILVASGQLGLNDLMQVSNCVVNSLSQVTII